MKRVLLPASLLLLAGCSAVGPRYAAPAALPETRLDQGSFPALPIEAGTHPRLASAWWDSLGDAELASYLRAVMEQNRSLAAAYERLSEARARLGLSRAEGSVTAQVNATARLAGESAERSLPLPNGRYSYRERGDTYRLPFEASWELDLWGRVSRSREAAGALYAGQEADLEFLQLSLVAEAATAYLNRNGLIREHAVLAKTLALRSEQINLLASRLRSGLTPALDLERARVEHATLGAELQELDRRIHLLDTTLAFLAGQTGTYPRPAETKALDWTPPAQLSSRVLERRPDIAAAERQLAARTAEIGVARAAFFPQIRLTGAVGFEGGDLGHLLEHPAQFWQVGPGLSYNLLDGGRNRRNLEAAQARARAAHEDYSLRLLTAFRETADALHDAAALREQRTSLETGLTAATDVQRLAARRYESGLTSYLEVLDAERTALSLTRSLAQVSTQDELARIRLIRALGGSWPQ